MERGPTYQQILVNAVINIARVIDEVAEAILYPYRAGTPSRRWVDYSINEVKLAAHLVQAQLEVDQVGV